MGVRPSELWGITWPLAAFYFDRAVRNWASFVDQRSDEAEMAVRNQMKNQRGSDSFILQARQLAFNKLVGLSKEAAYATPNITKGDKRSVDKVSAPKVLNSEGHKINLSRFNG